MTLVNIEDAKDRLQELIRQVQMGGEIFIADADGRLVATLTAYREAPHQGATGGALLLSDDFDEMPAGPSDAERPAEPSR